MTNPIPPPNLWTAARHQHELNTLGQRTSHEETLSEAGNFNGWVGYARRVQQEFVYTYPATSKSNTCGAIGRTDQWLQQRHYAALFYLNCL